MAAAADLLTMPNQIGDEFDESAPAVNAVVPRRFYFDGRPLEPYSFARRALHHSIAARDEDPANAIFTLGVIVILLASQEECAKWLFDVRLLRRAIIEYVGAFPPEKYPEAVKVVDEIIEDSKRGRVSAEPKPGGPEKKT